MFVHAVDPFSHFLPFHNKVVVLLRERNERESERAMPCSPLRTVDGSSSRQLPLAGLWNEVADCFYFCHLQQKFFPSGQSMQSYLDLAVE